MGFNQILRTIIGISEPWPVLHVRSSSDNIKESIAVLSRSGGALDQLICQFVQGMLHNLILLEPIPCVDLSFIRWLFDLPDKIII